MGKFKTALFFLIVAVSAVGLTVNTYAEAPVWDDFPDVRLLLGDVNPIDIELAQYVWSTTTDVFTFSTTTAGITISATSPLGGSLAGTNPGTGIQKGSAFPVLPGSLATDPASATTVTLVATNDEGSTEEEFKLKYSKFLVDQPRPTSDQIFASAAAVGQYTFRHVLNATEVITGGTTVVTGQYGITAMGSPVNPNALNWSTVVNRVAIQQMSSGGALVDRSLNSAERRMSVFPLAPRSNPVLASDMSITGVGVFVGNDGHYELTPHAAFTAPVLIGIRGDSMTGGPASLGYDGTFIFAAPAITGTFNVPGLTAANGPISLARDFSFEGITPNTSYQVGVFNTAGLNKWLLNRADTTTRHPTMSGPVTATVVALSGLGAAANPANQFPGAASGNVLRMTLPSDTGLNPTGKPYDERFVEGRMFFLSIMDVNKGGTYTFSANVATNVAAARPSSDTPHFSLMLGTFPHIYEYAYNEWSAGSVPRDGKWMTAKVTANFSDAFFNYTDPDTGKSCQPEYAGGMVYLGVMSPQPDNRSTAFQGAEVYFDNLRVYPSEFDLDLALGSTEVPWQYPRSGTGLPTGNLGGLTTPIHTAYGDFEAVAGSGATLAQNLPDLWVYPNTHTGEVGNPADANPYLDAGVSFGTNNFVTPNITGPNGHSMFLDPVSRGAKTHAGGAVFGVFDPHSHAPTQIFTPAIYSTRMFVRTNESNPNTVGRIVLAYLSTQRSDYPGGSDPLYGAQLANIGIPNQAGVWRQMTVEHPYSAASVQNLPVTGAAGRFGHHVFFILFTEALLADAGLNAELVALGQGGGGNIFGVNGDKSPGGAADCGRIYVDDIMHHRIDDAVALYDDSLFQ